MSKLCFYKKTQKQTPPGRASRDKEGGGGCKGGSRASMPYCGVTFLVENVV